MAIFAALPPLLPRDGAAQSISGRVVDDSDGRLIANVRVAVLPASSDSAVAGTLAESGVFRHVLPRPGAYRIRAEVLGYATLTTAALTVPDETVVTVELRLRPDAIPLEPLRILAQRREPWFMADVREREKLGFGTFMHREFLDDNATVELPDLIRRLPSTSIELVALSPSARGSSLLVPLASFRSGRIIGECYSSLYLNGVRIFSTDMLRDPTRRTEALLNADEFMKIRPADIEAVEVYRGAAALPSEFGGSTGECGAIAVWLRTDLGPRGRDVHVDRMNDVTVSVDLRADRFSGSLAPRTGPALHAAAAWRVRGDAFLDVGLTAARYQLAAETMTELTQRFDPRTTRIPTGARPLTVVAVSLGPRILLPRLGRIEPVLSGEATVARRAFSVPHRSGDRETEYSSRAWGFGAGAGAGVPLGERTTLRVTYSSTWMRFGAYPFPMRSGTTSAATWRTNSISLGMDYGFSDRYSQEQR